ncbi:hypothetical protein [Aromatoleum sp.]|uniref:hypothetical protein n=1 Tax=Aromatoleum sp. TaxID=2307007 RepID=UPI002FCAC261
MGHGEREGFEFTVRRFEFGGSRSDPRFQFAIDLANRLLGALVDDVEIPTPDVGDALRFGERGFAAPQRRLGPLARPVGGRPAPDAGATAGSARSSRTFIDETPTSEIRRACRNPAPAQHPVCHFPAGRAADP